MTEYSQQFPSRDEMIDAVAKHFQYSKVMLEDSSEEFLHHWYLRTLNSREINTVSGIEMLEEQENYRRDLNES